MVANLDYPGLKKTLEYLRLQVEDSMPYISEFIPDSITTPEELFYFLRRNTTYKKDPQKTELLQTVQTLFDRGGRGDCDCFTILTLAACEYLGFGPQEVALVGKTSGAPSHIYSLVWDEDKGQMCAMDLTNPLYCYERPYKFIQILPFNMRLVLEDNFPLLSKRPKKAARAEKKAAKVATKTAKKVGKQQVKQARVQAKTAKKVGKAQRVQTRAAGKTLRVAQRQDARANTAGIRQDKRGAKAEKGLIRQTGKGNVIRARAEGREDRVRARTDRAVARIQPEEETEFSPYAPAGGYNGYDGGDGDWDENDEEYYDEDYYDDYELLPDDEGDYDENDDEYYDDPDEIMFYDQQELSALPIITGLVNKGRKAVQKFQGSKVGQAAQQAQTEITDLVRTRRENEFLRSDLEREKRRVLTTGVVSGVLGLAGGFLTGKFIK